MALQVCNRANRQKENHETSRRQLAAVFVQQTMRTLRTVAESQRNKELETALTFNHDLVTSCCLLKNVINAMWLTRA